MSSAYYLCLLSFFTIKNQKSKGTGISHGYGSYDTILVRGISLSNPRTRLAAPINSFEQASAEMWPTSLDRQIRCYLFCCCFSSFLRLLCTQLNNNWQESVKEFKTQNDWAEMIFFCRLTATICSKKK